MGCVPTMARLSFSLGLKKKGGVGEREGEGYRRVCEDKQTH